MRPESRVGGRHHGGQRENRCRPQAARAPSSANRTPPHTTAVAREPQARRAQPKPTNRESNPAAYNHRRPQIAACRAQTQSASRKPAAYNRRRLQIAARRAQTQSANRKPPHTTAAARDRPQPPLPGRNDLRFDRRARFLRHRRIFSVYLFVQTPYPCPALPYRPPSPHRSRTRS